MKKKATTTSVISISGSAGTGTTTVSKLLSAATGFEHIYAGQIIRNLAEKHGMDIVEFNDYMKDHPEIDTEVDALIIKKAKEGKKILEGRLSGWMMKQEKIPAFKVYLSVSQDEQVKRISFRDQLTPDEALKAIQKRETGNKERYMDLYGINLDDESIYDLCIDTSSILPDEVTELIIKSWNIFKSRTKP